MMQPQAGGFRFHFGHIGPPIWQALQRSATNSNITRAASFCGLSIAIGNDENIDRRLQKIDAISIKIGNKNRFWLHGELGIYVDPVILLR
jgi:hypothetical protein